MCVSCRVVIVVAVELVTSVEYSQPFGFLQLRFTAIWIFASCVSSQPDAPGSVSADIVRLFLEMVASMDKMPSEVLARIHVSVVGEQPFAANSFEFVWTGGNAAISLCRTNYRQWFVQWFRDLSLLADTFAHWWFAQWS